MYLVAIIDWHSRLIVGWAMSNTMQSDFVIRAIEDAIKTYGTPEIMNSDQGVNSLQRLTSTALRAKKPLESVWTARAELEIMRG